MQKLAEPILLTGKAIEDQRGGIKFVNDFTFKGVKRFYEIEHKSREPRAFHGHLKEAKYAYVISGKALFCLARLDNSKRPSKKIKIKQFILSSENPQVLYIPPGYANGFKTLEKKTRVIFYSTLTLPDSIKDDDRLPYDYWGKEIWEI